MPLRPRCFRSVRAIWLYPRDVVGIRPQSAAAADAAFLVATFLVIPLSGVLHGGPVYTPGLVVTLVLGVFHARDRRVERFTLLAAAGVYLAALFFRTIDNEVCPVLPIGTITSDTSLSGSLRTWRCAP